MVHRITLSKPEIELAVQEGRRRCDRAFANGWEPTAGQSPRYKVRLKADQLGVAGEIAFALWLGRPWEDNIDSFKDPDVGAYQVRTVPKPGLKLIIRPEDHDDHIFVLVVRERSSTFRMAGWTVGQCGKIDAFLRAPAGRPAAFFVPKKVLIPMRWLPKG